MSGKIRESERPRRGKVGETKVLWNMGMFGIVVMVMLTLVGVRVMRASWRGGFNS